MKKQFTEKKIVEMAKAALAARNFDGFFKVFKDAAAERAAYTACAKDQQNLPAAVKAEIVNTIGMLNHGFGGSPVRNTKTGELGMFLNASYSFHNDIRYYHGRILLISNCRITTWSSRCFEPVPVNDPRLTATLLKAMVVEAEAAS